MHIGIGFRIRENYRLLLQPNTKSKQSLRFSDIKIINLNVRLNIITELYSVNFSERNVSSIHNILVANYVY